MATITNLVQEPNLSLVETPTQAVTLRLSQPLAPGLTDEQVALLKRTIAKDCTDDELALFRAICDRTGLDPFAREIYAMVRGQGAKRKLTIQTSIDGYRLIADRTGRYVGNDAPIYDTDSAPQPHWAKVTVYKLVAGQPRPFTATARWKEYCPAEDFMWQRMPFLMLGKVCEALALRKAFPQELSGLYTHEEMHQADGPPLASVQVVTGEVGPAQPPRETPPAPVPTASAETVMRAVNRILVPLKHAGLTKAVLHQCFGVDSPAKVAQLSPAALAAGMDLFQHLCTRLAEEGTPRIHPDTWVAQAVRKLPGPAAPPGEEDGTQGAASEAHVFDAALAADEVDA